MNTQDKLNKSNRKSSPNKEQLKEKSMNTIIDNKLIGTKEFRTNLSVLLNQVIHQKKLLTVGNQFRPSETATIIATDALESLVAHFTFTSTVSYDEDSKQYVAVVEQFNADGVGDTPEEAVEMALDNVEIAVESYFEKVDVFLKYQKYAGLYPYYLRAALAGNRDKLAQILGFNK
jgi:predicted RNase H-like HicB family nuclease